MNIQNLIFDLDGTLIDSSDGVVEAVNYSLAQFGEPPQPAEKIKRYIGFPLSRMYPDFTDAPIKELYHHFQIKAAETVVSTTTILPGVPDMLRQLHEMNYRMAIATTKVKRHVVGIIEKFNWNGYFYALVGGDEVSQVKPDPEAFKLALSRMEVEADRTIVIGDTINDVLAARGVPMKVLAVASPYGGRDQLKAASPDYFVDSVSEVVSVLQSL